MPQHEDIPAIVDDYLHGLLTQDEAQRVERNVQADPAWQAAMDEARRRLRALQTLPPAEVSEQLIQKSLGRIAAADTRKRLSPWRRLQISGVAAGLAATVALLATMHIYFANLVPTPGDLQVLGQTRLLAGAPASLRVRLIDHATGNAISGVPVDIEIRKPYADQPIRLASFTTDAQGTGQPRFALPDWEDGDYQLRVVAHPHGKREEVAHAISLRRSWQVMLSTDKPVYQPGQALQIRGLALRRPDLKPVAGQDAVFTLTDARGTLVFKDQQTTSKFGIAATQCPLAEEIREGLYNVTCSVGDTQSNTSIEIHKYALPRFKVELAVDHPYYAPGQTIHGTLDANYFFGQPVTGGRVDVRLQSPGIEETSAMRLTVRTDNAGHATFELPVPAGLQNLGSGNGSAAEASLSIMASVTDTAGQTHTRGLTRMVTHQPLRLEIIPEAGELVPGQANVLYVFAGYADGRPARVRLSVTGLDHEVQTNALGVGSFSLTPAAGPTGPTEPVALSLTATDAQGLTAQRSLTLPVGATSGKDGVEFLVRTDKAVYNGGETMDVLVLGEGGGPVYIDLLKDAQTMLTSTLAMSGGHGETHIDLPPDLFGTLELSAYRFDAATGLPHRRSQVIYVHPPKAIHVNISTDQTQYRPGGHAKLSFTLTGPDGRPLPGALSLAAVDDAVFSVLDNPGGR